MANLLIIHLSFISPEIVHSCLFHGPVLIESNQMNERTVNPLPFDSYASFSVYYYHSATQIPFFMHHRSVFRTSPRSSWRLTTLFNIPTLHIHYSSFKNLFLGRQSTTSQVMENVLFGDEQNSLFLSDHSWQKSLEIGASVPTFLWTKFRDAKIVHKLVALYVPSSTGITDHGETEDVHCTLLQLARDARVGVARHPPTK